MKKIVALFYCLSVLLLVLSCDPASALAELITPAAPDELDAVSSATPDPFIELTWRDNADNEEGYMVQRDISADFPDPQETLLEADQHDYMDETITVGQLYYYRICAFNAGGYSNWSETVSISITN